MKCGVFGQWDLETTRISLYLFSEFYFEEKMYTFFFFFKIQLLSCHSSVSQIGIFSHFILFYYLCQMSRSVLNAFGLKDKPVTLATQL